MAFLWTKAPGRDAGGGGLGFANYYQGAHAGKDAASGLGPGMVPKASAARGEDFGNFYQGQHAGKDGASGLGPGMVPKASAARGERFGDYYGGLHAGKDAASGLGPGMIPKASAARGERFGDFYQGLHAGKDAASGLGPGMVPKASAARGEAFGDFYQGLHAGRDALSGLGVGMVPKASAARGLAFDNFYQGLHAGRDSQQSYSDPVLRPAPRMQQQPAAIGASRLPPALPEPWVELHTNDGRAYYYNTETNESQWEKPKVGRRGKQSLTMKITNATAPADPDAVYTHGMPSGSGVSVSGSPHKGVLPPSAMLLGGDDMPPAATKKERVDQLKQEVEHINAQISSLVGRKAQLTAELGTLGYGGL